MCPVLFWFLRIQQGIKQTEAFVLRSCRRRRTSKVNAFHGPGRSWWQTGGKGKEQRGGEFVEGHWEGPYMGLGKARVCGDLGTGGGQDSPVARVGWAGRE